MPQSAVSIVQQYFPKVTKVVDAVEHAVIEVTKQDSKNAKVRNHTVCAMAVACKRVMKCDGVIISVKTCYLVTGTKAVRYELPESVSREVVSFDRDAGFDEGTYQLHPFSAAKQLGADKRAGDRHTDEDRDRRGKGKKVRFIHRTNGIRAALGSRIAPDGITRTHA